MPRSDDLKREMEGRWRSILPAFGLTAGHLSGKHGPCPLCREGKDRWRWDNKDGKGTWICTHCGSGDGFELVMRIRSCDFRAACDHLRTELGSTRPEREVARPGMSPEDIRDNLIRLWKGTRPISPGDAVDQYLAGRNLGLAEGNYPADLRFHPSCPVTGVAGVKSLPAMVALVRGVEGKGVQLHRTYLRNGQKAPIDSPRRVMPGSIPEGAAVRLFDVGAGGVLGVAEGIETALAAMRMWRIPTWAALNARMLERWRPPEGVKSVAVIGDNDANFAGHASAYSLAHRLVTKDKVAAKVWIPITSDADWADEWTAVCASGAERQEAPL